jgi:hypothetical protein
MTDREGFLRRRAYRTLEQLVMAALRGPRLPVTKADVEDSGIPEEHRPEVLEQLRGLQKVANDGNWGVARRDGTALAARWAGEWGDEIVAVDHSAEVKTLTDMVPRL